MASMTQTLRCWLSTGEVGRSCGVSPDTVRHYERLGLIPRATRSEAGYRQYPRETCRRVLVVQRALDVGFTLRELGEILRTRDQGGAPCQRVRGIAQQRLLELEERLREMARARRRLKAALRDWDARLAAWPPQARAYLLESLVDAES